MRKSIIIVISLFIGIFVNAQDTQDTIVIALHKWNKKFNQTDLTKDLGRRYFILNSWRTVLLLMQKKDNTADVDWYNDLRDDIKEKYENNESTVKDYLNKKKLMDYLFLYHLHMVFGQKNDAFSYLHQAWYEYVSLGKSDDGKRLHKYYENYYGITLKRLKRIIGQFNCSVLTKKQSKKCQKLQGDIIEPVKKKIVKK